MKVKLEKEDKKYITLAQAPIVRDIISDMKEDEIAKNNRVWNALNEHSGDFDVWIDATAYVSCADGYEFIIIGAYLSDI